jgi:hypothetical protein
MAEPLRAEKTPEFVPEIRKKIDLSDLRLWVAPVLEEKIEIRCFSPQSDFVHGKCPICCCRVDVCECCSHKQEPFSPPSTRRRSIGHDRRPRLVNTEDFRKSLVSMAQSIITNQKSLQQQASEAYHIPKVYTRSTQELSKGRDCLDTSPLIDAFKKVAQRPPDDFPIVPPIPFTSNQRESSVQTGRDQVRTSAATAALTARDQLKLVRLREKISARRILRCWRRYDHRRRLYKSRQNESDKHLKSMMKDVVMSALSNSRLIRDELTGIRNELLKTPATSPAPVTLPLPPPQLSPFSAPAPREPIFKSVRVLLGPSVLSPVAMDKFIDDLIAGKGRNAVRLCVSQQTLHPKAFIVVVSLENMSVDEWKSRVMNSYYVYAWDQAFPLYQSTIPGLPWEIRVKNEMSAIQPRWELTGIHASTNSSIG